MNKNLFHNKVYTSNFMEHILFYVYVLLAWNKL